MSFDAHALVIGVSQYPHIRPLPAVADADDIAGVLRDPAACGYDPARVTVVQEAAATRARILEELDRLAACASPASTVVIYFSGHGGRHPDSATEAYLMPFDGAWGAQDQLDATAISSRVLGARLAAIPAERLTVILDCCHAAGLAQARDAAPQDWVSEITEDALHGLAAGRGRVVMAAARGDGSAYVMTGARHGLFTEHLLAGLRGAAAGADGMIRVLDLYHHVQRNVVARNAAQRPVLKADLEDNYALARGARTVPAPQAAANFAYDVLVVCAPVDPDRTWAMTTLVRRLEDRGVRVCVEERDAEPGMQRIAELERLVTTSRFTLPVLTPRFSAARFEALQATMAQHLGVEEGMARLIPIIREPGETHLRFRMIVPIDMTRDEDVDRGVERLARTLARYRPPAP